MLLASLLPTLSIARSPVPAKHVKSFSVGNGTDAKEKAASRIGPLHVVYDDGARVDIQNETKSFSKGQEPIRQQLFSDIKLDFNRYHIGWLAEYMNCAQSYPCPMELVVLHAGKNPIHIRPAYGTVWRWNFVRGGDQVALQSGFPHGDTRGGYSLHDSETGRELARFPLKNAEVPGWVKQLRAGQ